MGTLQVGGTTLGVKNTVTNKVDLSNLGEVGSITGGNFGTITERSASSSSPTFSDDQGNTYDSTRLTNLFGNSSSILIGLGSSPFSTHAWIAWDYGSGNARKLNKLQFFQDSGAGNSTGIFLEGSNVDSPNASAGHSDWTQLKSFGNIVNDAVYSYSSPVTATTLKYRHYRIRYSWSSGNNCYIRGFVLEDTDSTFDARTALNATGNAPISACRAWAQFTISGTVESAFNVSSVEDTSSTVKKINFTTAMTDEFYACALTQINISDSAYYTNFQKKDESTSSQLQTYIESESNTYGYTIAVFR